MKSHVDNHDGLREYLAKMGTSVVESFEVSEAEYEKNLEDLRRFHPKGDLVEEAELRIHALANTIWHRYMVPFKPSEGKQILVGNELMIDVLKKILKTSYIIIGLLLLQAALAIKLHSQIDVIKFQDNTGATVKVFAGPFTFKAGANCTPSPSGSILTFNCAGGAAAAGGSDTQVQYNGAGSLAGASVGTYIVGSTKFKFQAGTHFDLTDPSDTTKVAEWDISQISAGATRLFTLPNVAGKIITATNLGTAGQMCGSNADGSCSFIDPIVSGPDAVAAAPTKNPVQVGCLFLTTPATLTNNQVGAVQCDATQNILVKVISAPSTAVTIADGASVTLGTKADARSTSTDTTAITIMQALKEISFMEQTPASRAVTNAGTFAVQATIADGADTTQGAKADAKSTATDNTAISIMSVLKQISASVQAPPSQAVTNAGTFAVQAALNAETTKVIGTVRTIGNAGANFDSPTGTAPPANAILAGGLASGATGGFNTAIPVSDTYKNINISTATTTLLVTGVSGRQVRIGAIHLVTALANNVALIEGTGATCGTGTAGMAGGTTAASGWNFAANTGLTLGSGLGTVIQTATTGDSVCIVTSAATQLSGGIQYAIY